MSFLLQTHLLKKFLPLVLLLAGMAAGAQPLNNEWINYSQTYYKFKVGRNGMYRISQATLQANGMGAVNAESFQLWRNGEQVPLFTSATTGPLGATGFIEFYGIMNDGKPDKVLYRNPAYQLNERVSLQTDTSAYFLTYNPTQPGLRYTAMANNIAGNTLAPEPYFTYTEKIDYKNLVNRGFADPSPGEYIYSSSYDAGEMVSSGEVYPVFGNYFFQPNGQPRNFYPYTGAGNSTIKVGIAGTAPFSRSVDLKIDSNTFGSVSLLGFEAKTQTYTNVPINYIPNGTGNLGIRNNSTNQNDRVVVSFIDVTYPRLFRFNNQSGFEFELAANSAGQYLEITNFNRGNALPVLYDQTNRRRYVADVNASGTIRFALPPSSGTTSYVLLSQDAAHVVNITTLQQRNFVNYASTANQGNFLIISNSILYSPVGGSSPVEQYRAYRASAAGGSFNAKIYDIDQLEDQFAFGIKKHPLSIKNFLRYARQSFSAPPKSAFIIGKGVSYQDYRFQQQFGYADRLNLVPTFGYPGSDMLLASSGVSAFPETPIGRLSVINGQEIINYLQKVKTYEAFQNNTSQTQGDKLWTKNIVHVVGASDAGTASAISPLMANYKTLIEDTLFGANVTTLNKYTTTTAANINNQIIGSLFQNGITLLTYFGHSSATALDYNLADPSSYNNPGKYPMFLLNGCNAGNFFTMDTMRFSVLSTISEKYVLAENRGSIGLIASTSFGLISNLDTYTRGFYRSIGQQAYGQNVGKNLQDAIQFTLNNSSFFSEYMNRVHAEQQTLHGDPAIKINSFALPDYSVEAPNVFVTPTVVSVAESQFKIKVFHYNLGKAINDSITVQVRRQYPSSNLYPNGFTETVYSRKIRATRYSDSLEITLPIIANRDKGTNRIIVTVESENRIPELSENNNTTSRELVVYEDEMRPVYPYNFAIVNKPNIKLVASTSSPVSATARPYRMELDTTEFFNSPLKVTRNISIAGGIAEFDPGISFTDSTVYYWRLASVPATGAPDRWNTSSFVYLPTSASTGYNQSHLFQHLKSGVERIYMDSASRRWKFAERSNNLFVTHSVYPVSGTEDGHFSISVNGNSNIRSVCAGHSLVFNVFDPITFKPWQNTSQAFGSAAYCNPTRLYNFEWDDRDTARRRMMMQFMDAIPNGYYVVVRKVLDAPYASETFAPQLQSDEAIYGTGNSLYHRFKNLGFSGIDSFNRPRTFILAYRKGDPTFTKWVMSNNLERIEMNENFPTSDTLGYVTSPVFGPAKAWRQVKWRGARQETAGGDFPLVSVIGINAAGNETVLYNLDSTRQDFDISSINVVQYPYLRLRMRNADSLNGTPYNLRYWRLLYDPVPEGALAANLLFNTKDTLEIGETLNFSIAFKNVSDAAFSDSIKIKALVINQSNVTHVLQAGRKKALQPGDTATISLKIDSRDYNGLNNLYLDVNPLDSAQPEQHHFNNFIYRNFFVRPDAYNPLLDVTFDGVHILNRDIVSARPHIQIKLTDESRFLLLNDTSLVNLTLRYPDGSIRTYRFGTDTLQFTPATASNNNTATIDFYPLLDQDSEDRYYELSVTGKDRVNNPAGPDSYNISFQVFNKPAISNLFNYPNPFTTSTAFVFTITGSEIPQEFKIQILTVTGKIVREITKAELGQLNIGRNITDFKWDGTDQYGGKLANGVYLYRVVTGLNGAKLDQFRINDNFDQNAQDQTDKFFNKGYGKMYLMR